MRTIEEMRRDAESVLCDECPVADGGEFLARDVLDLLRVVEAADGMREALDVARKSLDSYVIMYDRTADAAKAERAIRASSTTYDAAWKGATT